MRATHIVSVGVALALGACAQAMPGYQPPDAKMDKYRATIQKGGGFDDVGTYRLTDQEKALDCKALNGSITVKILQMRDAPNRTKASSLSNAMQTTVQGVAGGPTYGISIEQDLKRDRVRLEALNGQLAAKNCPTYDLDAELKPGNTATPRPVKPGRKKA
ncbi:MAG: hypothetical protein JSS20_01120 [Proteobacteria bacterium]|nr:hypothetical protein [Pseudomonadota bacterium]